MSGYPSYAKDSPWYTRIPRWAIVVGLVAVVGLIAVGIAAAQSSPREYLDEHYTHLSGDDPRSEPVTYRSAASPDATADDIVAGTSPDDREEAGTSEAGAESATYLRYDNDWLVTVVDDGAGGSRIELTDFEQGYQRHGTFIAFWGGFYGGGGSGFRGGGSGSGK